MCSRSFLLVATFAGCTTSQPAQLSDGEILGVLRSHAPGIRQCVVAQLAEAPGSSGKIKVSLVIRNDGLPTRIEVSPKEYEQTVIAECVRAEVATWRFPAFEGPLQPIDFPVVFRD